MLRWDQVVHSRPGMRSAILAAIALVACAGSPDGSAGDQGEPTPDAGAAANGGSDAHSGDGGRNGNADAGEPDVGGGSGIDARNGTLRTVFLIMMENHSWSTISTSDSAQYINGTLVSIAGHAENYKTPPGNHPSELNYIWLESGGNLGITTDDDPSTNHQSTTDHLVTRLTAAGISWKAYVEDISGNECPLSSSGTFAAKHTPQLFFDDVTGTNDPNGATCRAHVRPYTELASDLASDSVARFNFITPNLCNDMHGLNLGCGLTNFNEIGAGDTWLSIAVPKIMESNAFKNGGVIFIAWDEGDESLLGGASDGPMPFFVVSPKAKPGFKSMTVHTHSSTLRTIQEIFGLTPLLRDAANATDLSEFFTSFP
jgi:hypothetical protein